jgi:hypothetical protein
VAVLIVVVALCWVLRDEDRSWRLVQVIHAWRRCPAPAASIPISSSCTGMRASIRRGAVAGG